MIGLTIDPGGSTGICLFSYGDSEPFLILKLWQFGGGAAGLTAWMEQNGFRVENGQVWLGLQHIDKLIVEKFTPRDNEGFNLTLKACEPLVCEGVLIGRFFGQHILWRQPSMQYFMGDSRLPKAEKKKLARQFLKLHGLLPSAAANGWSAKDKNDDAVSAILHSISMLRKIKHMPTLERLFPETGEFS